MPGGACVRASLSSYQNLDACLRQPDFHRPVPLGEHQPIMGSRALIARPLCTYVRLVDVRTSDLSLRCIPGHRGLLAPPPMAHRTSFRCLRPAFSCYPTHATRHCGPATHVAACAEAWSEATEGDCGMDWTSCWQPFVLTAASAFCKQALHGLPVYFPIYAPQSHTLYPYTHTPSLHWLSLPSCVYLDYSPQCSSQIRLAERDSLNR